MYKIIFEDGTTFIGGNPENSKWNEMPNKPIQKLYYNLLGNTIILENYKAYNHLVEKVFILNEGRELMTKVMLLVEKVDGGLGAIIFDLRRKLIDYREISLQEANAVTGWKKGIVSNYPYFNRFKQERLEDS